MNIPRPTRDLTSLTRPRCDLRHTGGLPAKLEVWTNIQVVPLMGEVRVNLHVDGFCYGAQIQRSGAEVSVSKTTSRGRAPTRTRHRRPDPRSFMSRGND